MRRCTPARGSPSPAVPAPPAPSPLPSRDTSTPALSGILRRTIHAGTRAETRKASSSAASAASALAGSTLSGDSNSEHSSAPPRALRARWSRSHSVIRVDPLLVSDRNDPAFEPIAALVLACAGTQQGPRLANAEGPV